MTGMDVDPDALRSGLAYQQSLLAALGDAARRALEAARH